MNLCQGLTGCKSLKEGSVGLGRERCLVSVVPGDKRSLCDLKLIAERSVVKQTVGNGGREGIGEQPKAATNDSIVTGTEWTPGKAQPRLPAHLGVIFQR